MVQKSAQFNLKVPCTFIMMRSPVHLCADLCLARRSPWRVVDWDPIDMEKTLLDYRDCGYRLFYKINQTGFGRLGS